MSGTAGADDATFGLSASTLSDLRAVFDAAPGIERVWIFGSRAAGRARPNSDVDLAVDAPSLTAAGWTELLHRLEAVPTLYKLDVVRWQQVSDPVFRAEIERDRRLFWAPRRHAAAVEAIGGVSLKAFQSDVLQALDRWLDALKVHRTQAESKLSKLAAMEDMEDVARSVADFPAKAWDVLRRAQQLPPRYAQSPYQSRFDGAGRAVPSVCLKVPTGGGKTLLAAASVARVCSSYLGRHTGLVLWVVPNEAIYRQTWTALSDRDHPYRQMLNVAGAGRVKLLDKTSPLTRADVDSHLCVMVLMLQSAARQSKETLRFFRDRGNVLGFVPGEDDIEAHWALLNAVPNLDVYAPFGASAEAARRQKGSIVKSSLGNVMRMVRPMVVIDEGHHAYTDNALATIDGFNPCFMLELSATPRLPGPRSSGANILVDVRGTDLDEAEMIKLPIHVEVKRWNDWQSCLAASVERLRDLQQQAEVLRADTLRYIRPILLVQVERTGTEQRDAGFIHAEDARSYLLQLGFTAAQIAVKTSEKNDLANPENLDLLSPTCEVRAIITKQALQEGWDCPFAYVLCALAAGRQPAAMTQLLGRILRQPQVTKTGRADLDACWVLCHDAGTGQVVNAIKRSLEEEGMGDLGATVTAEAGDGEAPRAVPQTRRPAFRDLRVFLPRVCWVEPDGQRRELDYESDVLAHVAWEDVRTAEWARLWAPEHTQTVQQFDVTLSVLDQPDAWVPQPSVATATRMLDRARLVRALADLVPNPWWLWQWVEEVIERLLAQGFSESALAASSASLGEALRVAVAAERDRLAQQTFERLLTQGRIEFRLRADALDYALPEAFELTVVGEPALMQRGDALPMHKSLFEPCLRTADVNDFEVAVAGYLDQQAALRWWHRNVARAHYGLQGWQRHRVFPDFVFALQQADGGQRLVLLETKGLQLKGADDTRYKQALLARLSEAFQDARSWRRVGELDLMSEERIAVSCDLVFEEAWRGELSHRYFVEGTLPADR